LFKDVFFPGAEYYWQDGSVYYDYSVKSPGTYWVEAYNSCFSTFDTVVIDYDDCGTCVHVPNAFTPNTDGINDQFLPVIGCDFTNYSMRVYNRWGQMVFLTKDPMEGWNGMNESKPSEVGTYVWYITYTGVQHNLALSEELKGSVLLIR
jgi:gliding motility-associated-like protein